MKKPINYLVITLTITSMFLSFSSLALSSNKDDLKNQISLYFLCEKNYYLDEYSNIDLNSITTSNFNNELYYKYKFLTNWNKKLQMKFSQYDYDIEFIDFNISNSNAKIHVKRNLNCSLINKYKFSSFNEDYLFFFSNKNNSWKIENVIFKEENENLFNIYNKFNIPYISRNKKWKNNYKNIDKLFNEYKEIKDNLEKSHRSSQLFDAVKSASYARTYALSYNNAYKNYDNSGGDCTNFVSQSIHAGGIPLSKKWKPYNDSWINVNLLRNYLIYNSFASEYTVVNNTMLGSPIQFYNTDLKRYSHSGIITVEFENGDYGYCAHSYNKLDYPLSLSYPVIYPKIRTLKITY